jgi:hypothetical protein
MEDKGMGKIKYNKEVERFKYIGSKMATKVNVKKKLQEKQ